MTPLKLFIFTLPINSELEERKGLLLKREGLWAEVSPLPLWSQENLEECIQNIEGATHFPSIAFGLSSLNPYPPHSFSLPLAALLFGSPDEIIEKGERALKEGYRHAKVKVGHLSAPEAQRVLGALYPHFKLRVDVNRLWPAELSLSLFSHFPKEAFEFVEEPVNDPAALPLFTHPFALDETLREHPHIFNRPLPNLRALVIKPTLTGSVQTCLKWARAAQKQGVSVVISSSFESGVGTFHLAQLAKRVQSPGSAVGLDPYTLLKDDVLSERLQIKEGRIYIPQNVYVDSNKIEEISCEPNPLSRSH